LEALLQRFDDFVFPHPNGTFLIDPSSYSMSLSTDSAGQRWAGFDVDAQLARIDLSDSSRWIYEFGGSLTRFEEAAWVGPHHFVVVGSLDQTLFCKWIDIKSPQRRSWRMTLPPEEKSWNYIQAKLDRLGIRY